MSGKTKGLAKTLTQIYFLINMKKILLFVPQLTNSVLAAQCLENASLSEFLKKNGEFGGAYFLRTVKYLENSPSIEAKINGLKLGKV